MATITSGMAVIFAADRRKVPELQEQIKEMQKKHEDGMKEMQKTHADEMKEMERRLLEAIGK